MTRGHSGWAKIEGMLRPLLEPSFFVGWGTLALITAGIAQGKERGGLLWFILSILFGPLAVLILVLLPTGK